MGIKLEETLEEKLKDKILNLGFEIEYVENVSEASQNIIRFVIDKKDSTSITIDDCELVSRSIEDDVDKYVNREYILEVSSPGLERQLKNIKLYKKYQGKEIYVKLFKKIDNVKEITGILENVDENNRTIILNITSEDNKKVEISLENISSAHTTYDFDEALKNNKVNLNELKRF